MVFRSQEPDVAIPADALAAFVTAGFEGFGERPALIDGATSQTVSYRQLHRQSRAIAAALARRGAVKGDVLAIALPNLPIYAAAFIGAAAAGLAISPMNPMLTPADIRHQLRDTGARWMLTFEPILGNVLEAAEGTAVQEIFCLTAADRTTPLAALLDDPGNPGDWPSISIDPANDLLALPYSSGTSGLPKGVMLTHRNLVAQLCQAQVMLRQTAGDVCLAVAPFFHILGMALVLLHGLRNGVTLVTLPRFEPAAFLSAIQTHRVSHVMIVPPVMLFLAKHPLVASHDLSSVKWLMCGAAPLAGEIEQACADRLHCEAGQGWGMTEVAGAGASIRLQVAPDLLRGANGRLWPNIEARIIDVSSGADVGAGQEGELWVRGPNVMRGYLGNPDATAATLLPDGWMRTGDVARFDDRGFLHIVDRIKELIKYNAYQIAPAELEAILSAHPAVADAAVIPSPDAEHGEIPKAYVVLKGAATADELIEHVAARVAPYKKVRSVRFVDTIPRSPSGKLLRRMLIEQERAAAS